VPASDDEIARDTDADWIAFSSLDRMKSHWDRPGWWPGRRAYYWYLTFSEESELHAIAAQCQAELEAPYLDRVPITDLHMTIERVAFDDEISETKLDQIASAADEACRTFSPFTLYIGPLAGSSGAISFSASPHATIAHLRNTLVTATKTVLGEASRPDSAHFRPHVGIAYCNKDVAMEPIISTITPFRRIPIIEVNVRRAALVALTRGQNSYRWIERYTIPLGMV
jgi:2'-5' RNA ligase